MVRVLFVLVCLVGCAVPRNPADFSIVPASGGDAFLSSNELLVSGMVSESVTIATKGRFFDAESRLRKALFLSPGDPIISYNLAVVLGQQGYADEALSLLKQLREKQGEHPRYYLASADVYVAQGNLLKAREQLKAAFEFFIEAQNWSQAALVARSVSNLAFADGSEQEALCYSSEAFFLERSAVQLGYHVSLLVALNQFEAAEAYAEEQLVANPAMGASPRVHLARALARGALGNISGAVKEIEVAQDLVSQDPELGAEVNVVWWLLKTEAPKEPAELEDVKLQESLKAVFPEVLRLKEKPVYSMVRWPRQIKNLLEGIDVEDHSLE